MLPDAQDAPAPPPQPREVAPVAPAVRLDPLDPVRGERVPPGGEPPAMPEVSIDEHGHSRFRENEVGRSGQFAHVLAEAQTACVDRPAHGDLDASVLAGDAGHPAAVFLGRPLTGHARLPTIG